MDKAAALIAGLLLVFSSCGKGEEAPRNEPLSDKALSRFSELLRSEGKTEEETKAAVESLRSLLKAGKAAEADRLAECLLSSGGRAGIISNCVEEFNALVASAVDKIISGVPDDVRKGLLKARSAKGATTP